MQFFVVVLFSTLIVLPIAICSCIVKANPSLKIRKSPSSKATVVQTLSSIILIVPQVNLIHTKKPDYTHKTWCDVK